VIAGEYYGRGNCSRPARHVIAERKTQVRFRIVGRILFLPTVACAAFSGAEQSRSHIAHSFSRDVAQLAS
jgi:hypothetical protein